MIVEIRPGYIYFKLEKRELMDYPWRQFLDSIKDSVPAQCRGYDEGKKRWWIREEYKSKFDELRVDYFGDKHLAGFI